MHSILFQYLHRKFRILLGIFGAIFQGNGPGRNAGLHQLAYDVAGISIPTHDDARRSALTEKVCGLIGAVDRFSSQYNNNFALPRSGFYTEQGFCEDESQQRDYKPYGH